MKNPLSHFPHATCHLLLSPFHLPLATCHLLLATFLISPQTPKAQEWSNPVTIYSGNINRDLDAVVDSNGHLHVVWAHMVSTNYWWILYSKSTDQGETWYEPYSVGQNQTGWLSSPKITVDLNNKLYVTYDSATQNPYQTTVRLQVFDGNQWGQSSVVSEGYPGSYYSRLAMKSNGELFICWYYPGGTGRMFYRTYYNGVFSQILPAQNEGIYYLIHNAIYDKNDVLHCLGSHNVNRAQLHYFTYSNSSWSDSYMISNTNNGRTLALDFHNTPQCVWYNSVTDRTFHATPVNNEWITSERLTSYSQDHTLLIQEDGTRHLVFANGTNQNKQLNYLKYTDNNWSIQAIANAVYGYYDNKLLIKDSVLFLFYHNAADSDVNNCFVSMRKLIIDGNSSITSGENISDCDLVLYPNPAKNQVTLEITTQQSLPISIEIFDVSGNLIYKRENISCLGKYTLINWDCVDMYGNPLLNGLYVVHVKSENNSAHKLLFISK